MRKIYVAPSLLAADIGKLGHEVALAVKSGADYLHFDIMDGHFVPNISFGIPVVQSLAKTHPLVNDVHIMIADPLQYAPEFVKAGADIVTFHYEALKTDAERHQVINAIVAAGGKPGMSIKPGTDVHLVVPFLRELRLVLIMSVEPGFGGQKFMDNALEKIAVLRKIIDEKHLFTLIEVDGGINEETATLCKAAGVDILVAGSYLFGHADIEARISLLKKGLA